LARAALLAACLVTACGGQSIAVGGEDGSAGEGDTGGSGGSGAANTGGSAHPAGGTSDGGTVGIGGGVSTGGSTGGVAGTTLTGGAAGSIGIGGADPCPECPAARYGLVVQGDGAAYDLTYNGFLTVNSETDAEQLLCPEQPVRGMLIGCGGGVYLTVCEDPMSGPPCLSVTGGTAMYVDQQTGAFWSGAVVSNVVITPDVAPGVVSGTLTIEFLNPGGGMLRLTVDYTFCATGVRTAGICR
jgi:hypothetical protein